MPIRLFTFFALCCVTHALPAQWQGKVTDLTGEPLAFVSIRTNNTNNAVVLSDIEGKFLLPASNQLEFRYVGYETLTLDSLFLSRLKGKTLYIKLFPSDNLLPEAIITPSEDPAYAIIRKAIDARITNNPENYHSFICNTYNKISADLLPNRGKLLSQQEKKDSSSEKTRHLVNKFNNLETDFQKHHLLFIETVTERYYRKPNRTQEKVLLNKVSGFKDMGLVALAGSVQPFTFYGDFLRILDRDYINPISAGSTEMYQFTMMDTLPAGRDTIWVIRFKPKKNKIFQSLEGFLHIHSLGYAIQNVKAQPAFSKGNLNLKIEQAYQLVPVTENPSNKKQSQSAEHFKWFPEQLNFEIELPRYPAAYLGTRVSGKSFVSCAKIDVKIPEKTFIPRMPVYIAPVADQNKNRPQAWEFWHLPAPLNHKEINTYNWLDSVGKKARINLVNDLFNYATTGIVPLPLNQGIDLQKMLRFNQFEGLRPGIAITNAEPRPLRLPRRFEWGADAGVGIRDNSIKWNAYTTWRITRFSETQLSVQCGRDILEPGALHEMTKADYVNRTLYARKIDYARYNSFSLSSGLGRGVKLQIGFQQIKLTPAYPCGFLNSTGESIQQFHLSEITSTFKYAPDIKFRSFMGDAVDITNKIPIFELGFARGLNNIAGGKFNYERWTMAVHQSIFISKLGRLRWRIEAGIVSPNAPLAKLFTLNQSSSVSQNVALFALRNTFQALPFDKLTLSDQFINVFFSQEFGPFLYIKKYSAPEFAIGHSIAMGKLRAPQNHQEIDFVTPTNPFQESSIRFDNLLRFNYVNVGHIGMGAALFYRWGGLDYGKWNKNIAPRLALRFILG